MTIRFPILWFFSFYCTCHCPCTRILFFINMGFSQLCPKYLSYYVIDKYFQIHPWSVTFEREDLDLQTIRFVICVTQHFIFVMLDLEVAKVAVRAVKLAVVGPNVDVRSEMFKRKIWLNRIKSFRCISKFSVWVLKILRASQDTYGHGDLAGKPPSVLL